MKSNTLRLLVPSPSRINEYAAIYPHSNPRPCTTSALITTSSSFLQNTSHEHHVAP